MDRTLMANWNAVVRPDDDVWVVGDFVMGNGRTAQSYLDDLNGRKHLVRGNHDKAVTLEARGWSSIQDMAEVSLEGRHLVLSHYGMRTWHRIGRSALMLYGHSHGRLPGFRTPSGGGTTDVGVDLCHYMLVQLDQILTQIKELPMSGEFGQEAGDL